MTRSLSELQLRAGVLTRVIEVLSKGCFGIAREKSPSAAFQLATVAAKQSGISGLDVIAVAKATRWLAVIRRDHGESVFEETVRTLTKRTV